MRSALSVGALALLLVLAGCVGPFADGTGPSTAEPSPAATELPADEPTETPIATGGLSADNPFGQAVVPVRVNDSAGDGRNATALVETAIDYWNANVERYTPFDYRFVLADDPSEARVEVRFVDEIQSCGRDHDGRTVGCAPLVEQGETAPDVAVTRVEMHGSNSAVVGTIEHELGHILGLGHDVEPYLVMGQSVEHPVANATDRAVPWYTNELSVFVDDDSLRGDPATIDEQVGHALRYYDRGAAGTIPANVSFRRTDHRPSADVVITNDEAAQCGGLGRASAIVLEGVGHVDTDPAIEAYTRVVICVGADVDALGWHVGYSLGRGMGLEVHEMAEPFQDATYVERRSDWWE